MSYRAEKSGLAAETHDKVQAKYDPKLSEEILKWINLVLSDGNNIIENTDGSMENFQKVLKDGVLICKLANSLKPGSVKNFKENTTMAFKCMDNINAFLKSLDQFDIQQQDRFQTIDLWEGINLYSVQICLAALARKATKFGKPGFGPKEAEENRRSFTEEQLKQGETIIHLQYGSNKGANASGVSFGTKHRI